jgi:hypothetical protein
MLPGSSCDPTPPAMKQFYGMCCYLKTSNGMFVVNLMKPLSSHYFCHFLMSRSSFDTPRKKHNLDRYEGITLRCAVKCEDCLPLI